MQEVIGSTPIFSTTDSTTAFRKGRRFFLSSPMIRGLLTNHAPNIRRR